MRFFDWLRTLLGGTGPLPPPAGGGGDWRARMLAAHNDRRPGHPLQLHPGLGASAQAWAEHLAATGTLTHGDWLPRLQAAAPELTEWCENVARGQRTPEQAVSSWMSDGPHASNLTNPAHRFAGFGFAGSVYVADYGG